MVGLSVYKQNEVGPKGPKYRFDEPECSPADFCTFLRCLLAWKSSFYLSFMSGSVAVMLVGRCYSTPLPKYIPVPSSAEENNAQTVTSYWCLERLGSLWASSLTHRHGVTALTVRSVLYEGRLVPQKEAGGINDIQFMNVDNKNSPVHEQLGWAAELCCIAVHAWACTIYKNVKRQVCILLGDLVAEKHWIQYLYACLFFKVYGLQTLIINVFCNKSYM